MTGHRDRDLGQTEDEGRRADEGTRDDATLRLLAEELAVAKEKVETYRGPASSWLHPSGGSEANWFLADDART